MAQIKGRVWKFKSLTGLAMKMGRGLSVAVVARIEDALRDLTMKITDLYIRQLAIDYNITW